jgi:predicted DNA-binding antitoxin AbrB/MazE fold protein
VDITIEATYESGVFKPVEPLTHLKDHERVRIIVQPLDIVEQQSRNRIKIDPKIAREIAESAEFDLLNQ